MSRRQSSQKERHVQAPTRDPRMKSSCSETSREPADQEDQVEAVPQDPQARDCGMLS